VEKKFIRRHISEHSAMQASKLSENALQSCHGVYKLATETAQRRSVAN